MDGGLYCNHKGCHKQLSAEAWLTTCFHIFCSEHAPSAPASVRKCPTCSKDLREKNDVYKRNLNPTDAYKSVALAGFCPSTIIDIGFKALEFLNFQSFHEKIFLQTYIKRQHLKLAKAEVQQNTTATLHQEKVDQLKSLIQQQAQKCEELQRDLAIFTKKTQFLEQKVQDKNRMLHKMLAKYGMQRQSSHHSECDEQSEVYRDHREPNSEKHTFLSQQAPSRHNPHHTFTFHNQSAHGSRLNESFRSMADPRSHRNSYDGRMSHSQQF